MGRLKIIDLNKHREALILKADMELHFDSDPHTFLKNIEPTLGVEGSVHSFILSLTSRYIGIQKPMTLMARGVKSNGELLVAGLQTELDRVMIISKISESEAAKFAELLSQKIDFLPGVNGPVPAVDAFAHQWTSLKKISAKLCGDLRLFELKALKAPPLPSGFARLAGAIDRDLLFQWLRAFHDEAVPHDPQANDNDLYKNIDTGIAQKEFFIWEDCGKAVSLVGSRRETATERWIAPVYTPLENRGHGYASALTAHVSRKILDLGKTGMLFTNLANPTSNRIYQNIGYTPVADFKHYSFS